jgi:ligand-binding sensor domain-containing protein
VWVGTERGLSKLAPASGKTFQGYTPANNLSDVAIHSLAEDHDGNLWIGTEAGAQ